MKGEVFNLFEGFVTENWGEEVFDEIYEEAHPQLVTKDPFIGPGTYPDSDFMAIVGKAVEKLQTPLNKAVYAFGKYSFPKLAAKLPEHTESFTHPKDFLKTVHDVIHVEVKKVYKDAEPPDFSYRDPAPDKLIMIYKSKRKLYDFAEGLFAGVSDYYKTPISVSRKIIQQDDGEACEFELTFG